MNNFSSAVTVAFCVAMIAGWITHVTHTIAEGDWLLLIAGAIMVPVGVIHGIGIWFGAW